MGSQTAATKWHQCIHHCSMKLSILEENDQKPDVNPYGLPETSNHQTKPLASKFRSDSFKQLASPHWKCSATRVMLKSLCKP